MLISVQGSLGGGAAPGAGGPLGREFPSGPAAAPRRAGGTGGGGPWSGGAGCGPQGAPALLLGGATAAVPPPPGETEADGRGLRAATGTAVTWTAVTCGTAQPGQVPWAVFASSGLHLCRPHTAPESSPVPTPLPVQGCPWQSFKHVQLCLWWSAFQLTVPKGEKKKKKGNNQPTPRKLMWQFFAGSQRENWQFKLWPAEYQPFPATLRGAEPLPSPHNLHKGTSTS